MKPRAARLLLRRAAAAAVFALVAAPAAASSSEDLPAVTTFLYEDSPRPVDFDHPSLLRLVSPELRSRFADADPDPDSPAGRYVRRTAEAVARAVQLRSPDLLRDEFEACFCSGLLNSQSLALLRCGHVLHEPCFLALKWPRVCPKCRDPGPHENRDRPAFLRAALAFFESAGWLPPPRMYLDSPEPVDLDDGDLADFLRRADRVRRLEGLAGTPADSETLRALSMRSLHGIYKLLACPVCVQHLNSATAVTPPCGHLAHAACRRLALIGSIGSCRLCRPSRPGNPAWLGDGVFRSALEVFERKGWIAMPRLHIRSPLPLDLGDHRLAAFSRRALAAEAEAAGPAPPETTGPGGLVGSRLGPEAGDPGDPGPAAAAAAAAGPGCSLPAELAGGGANRWSAAGLARALERADFDTIQQAITCRNCDEPLDSATVVTLRCGHATHDACSRRVEPCVLCPREGRARRRRRPSLLRDMLRLFEDRQWLPAPPAEAQPREVGGLSGVDFDDPDLLALARAHRGLPLLQVGREIAEAVSGADLPALADALECPWCFEPVLSDTLEQMECGHVAHRDCLPFDRSCPVCAGSSACRADPALLRLDHGFVEQTLRLLERKGWIVPPPDGAGDTFELAPAGVDMFELVPAGVSFFDLGPAFAPRRTGDDEPRSFFDREAETGPAAALLDMGRRLANQLRTELRFSRREGGGESFPASADSPRSSSPADSPLASVTPSYPDYGF